MSRLQETFQDIVDFGKVREQLLKGREAGEFTHSEVFDALAREIPKFKENLEYFLANAPSGDRRRPAVQGLRNALK